MKYKILTISYCSLLLLSVAGCVSIPDGVEPVKGFQLSRYLGKWYEIARLDHSFERGLSNVSAEYSLRDDGGVRVVNRGYDQDNDEWNEAIGKGYFIGDSNIGQLKVSFFGPFYGAYNIIELDKEGYQYSLVSGPDYSYLWILARTTELEQSIIKSLVEKPN